MNRKGFAYTTFALLSSTILLSIVFGQVYQPEGIQTANSERIGEASFFLDSVLSDIDRSLGIASRRSLTGATNYVVTEGEPLENPEENVSEVLVNGTLGGEEVESVGNASLSEWENRVAAIGRRSGYRMNISVTNYSFRSDRFELDPSFTVEARLFDPTTLAAFNRSESTSTSVSLEGLEDPMITLRSKGRYTTTVERCGFSDPAEELSEASQNSSTVAHGQVVIEPADGESVGDQGEKVLVVEDPDSYDHGYTSGFEAVIAAQESSSPSDVNSDYALGTGTIDGFSERSGAVIDSDRVWSTGFVEMFREGCYVPSDTGPDFFDRLGNDLTGDGDGLATLIDLSRLPPEFSGGSAVGYVYFNDNRSTDLNRIKGVSDDYSWFRIDDRHVSEWGMEGLVE